MVLEETGTLGVKDKTTMYVEDAKNLSNLVATVWLT
jgi:hypothetical protein